MKNEEIYQLVIDEVKRAETKWPAYYSDIIHATGLICEEAGEAIQAALDMTYDKGSIDKVIGETVQTAAMCWRLLGNIKHLKEVKNFITDAG